MRNGERLVECEDCGFERTVGADADVRAAELLLYHGRHTGHDLRVERLEG